MDNDSDEGTSAGNTTFVNECGICGAELEKKMLCEGLSTGSNLDSLCGKCVVRVVQVNEVAARRLDELKVDNGRSMNEMVRKLKELQEVKNSSLARIKEFRAVDAVKSQIWALQRDFRDCISVIMTKQNEKLRLCDELNQKQNILYECINKVTDLENGVSLPIKQTSTEEYLMDENQELLEKIRDFEIEIFLFKKDLFESLQIVKSQIAKERSLRPSSQPYSNIQSLGDLIGIRESLQEENRLIRRKIEALSDLHSFS